MVYINCFSNGVLLYGQNVVQTDEYEGTLDKVLLMQRFMVVALSYWSDWVMQLREQADSFSAEIQNCVDNLQSASSA